MWLRIHRRMWNHKGATFVSTENTNITILYIQLQSRMHFLQLDFVYLFLFNVKKLSLRDCRIGFDSPKWQELLTSPWPLRVFRGSKHPIKWVSQALLPCIKWLECQSDYLPQSCNDVSSGIWSKWFMYVFRAEEENSSIFCKH